MIGKIIIGAAVGSAIGTSIRFNPALQDVLFGQVSAVVDWWTLHGETVLSTSLIVIAIGVLPMAMLVAKSVAKMAGR